MPIRDQNGIPVLGKEGIEELAERFLAKTAPRCLSRVIATPLLEIVEILQRERFFRFSREELGYTVDGLPLLGCYNVEEKLLLIDSSLDERDPRFRFTLAHELGHFYLHSRISCIGGPVLSDDFETMLTGSLAGKNPVTLMEWQANRFASAILLPRKALHAEVKTIQLRKGIPRAGRIWLDHQKQNWVDYNDILMNLINTFQTSRTVLDIRLRQLQIVEQDPRSRPHKIGQVLEDALRELFSRTL